MLEQHLCLVFVHLAQDDDVVGVVLKTCELLDRLRYESSVTAKATYRINLIRYVVIYQRIY